MSDAARGADDQDVMTRSHQRLVSQRLQRRESGKRNGGRLFEGHPLRLVYGPIGRRRQILGERTVAHAEHRLTRSESR